MKAIVVFDLPDDFDINSTCVAMDIVDKNDNWITIAERVKPMPEKKAPMGNYYGWNMMVQGWNECIEEIEK
ncbi:MAG: hypothetical protein IJF87_05895 [Erysipelotrichaceae bacterium]|nr:hypothetical protein [Erysipelotrichaceae bacterium]